MPTSQPPVPPPIKTILVPTGFSDLSKHAARYAMAIAPALGARLIVLHAVAPAPPAVEAIAINPTATIGTDMGTLLNIGKEGLERFIKENMSGVAVESIVTVGPADHEIVQAARREKADLIVMGTHARGMLNRIVFGSISKSVLESAPCPVLLVPIGHAAKSSE